MNVHEAVLEAHRIRFAYEIQAGWPLPHVNLEPCTVCNRPRRDFPMAFIQDDYCSDRCRKRLGRDYPQR